MKFQVNECFFGLGQMFDFVKSMSVYTYVYIYILI